MSATSYTFPFGQPLRPVVQQDRSPKRVFILGVYASAVHARWIGPDGRTRITALAVAPEPYIFWRGDGAEEIVEGIEVPEEAGRLVAAAANLNGPSGVTLDRAFIEPLRLTRDDCWLCDIYPHACMNPRQRAAVEGEYMPLVEKLGLPLPDMPPQRREPDTVTMIEKWSTLEALKAHLAAPHMAAYRVKVEGMVAGVTLKVLQEA